MTSQAPDRDYVAFDVETTGLNLATDRVIEIGAVRFSPEGSEREVFDRLINPGQPSGLMALAVHGITDRELQTAALPADVLPEFLDFLGPADRTVLLAHSATIDAGFLGAELARIGYPLPGHAVVDTLNWSRVRWPGPTSHKLVDLAARFGVAPTPAHRALADARRVVGLTRALWESGFPGETPLAYPIYDGRGPIPPPLGWQPVFEAIGRNAVLEIEYEGGTRGAAPRAVTPSEFVQRGGVAYLLAVCHLDGRDKEFRLDRVRRYQVREDPAPKTTDLV